MNVREMRGLTISEFGRRCGLSIKALRLYDLSGLLPPAEVDPLTGYRRYAAARLDRWWAGQEQAMAAKRGSLGWLRTQLVAGSRAAEAYAVHRREVPATKVASIRQETDQQGLADTIRTLQWRLRKHLAGATTTAEHWVLYHGFVTPDNEAPVEVCVPFTGPAEPVGPMVIRLEPAHAEVYATVARDDCFYPRIMQAYQAVEEHVAAVGLASTAAPREVYIAHWDEIAGSDPFVHVAQPV
jgi:hypothetical protein